MFTAKDDRSSHTKNSKNKKSCITITLHIVKRQYAAVYNFFLFLLFLMFELRSFVAVNIYINCSFVTLIAVNTV